MYVHAFLHLLQIFEKETPKEDEKVEEKVEEKESDQQFVVIYLLLI